MKPTEPQARLTGLDLAVARRVARVTQVDLARALGVVRQRVGNLEATAWPSPAATRRYMDALAACEQARDDDVRPADPGPVQRAVPGPRP